MHNRKPNRMREYDYSQDNLYFVTSCVEKRVCCFGEINSGKMGLNEYGKIAEKQWHWLGEQYPYIKLHEFVVMPNHIHGIIEINRSIVDVGTGRDLSVNDEFRVDVGTGRDLSLHRDLSQLQKIKSLSELMGAYKTTTSKQIHLIGNKTFAWQRSFHDHIIRDEKSFDRISNYISDNPSKWDLDQFHVKH